MLTEKSIQNSANWIFLSYVNVWVVNCQVSIYSSVQCLLFRDESYGNLLKCQVVYVVELQRYLCMKIKYA